MYCLSRFFLLYCFRVKGKTRFLYKTTGAVLAPFDSWLILRGIKTLGVRMERAQENAMAIAEWLKGQKIVTDVIYPGLPEHPGHADYLSGDPDPRRCAERCPGEERDYGEHFEDVGGD